MAQSATTLLIFLCLNQFVVATMSTSAKFYTIHWNSSNPIFRIDNTDNVIDVNRNNMKFEYDQVNLICPVYMPGTRDDDLEKYIIYNVSKEEYETCRITNANPRIIAVCDKPFKLMYFTITFRPFTPQPGGLEFLPGHDYYFISTSTSDDLHRRIGGRCSSHNMKIVFKVWAPPNEINTTPSNNGNVNVGGGGGGGGGGSISTIGGVTPQRTTNNNNNKWLPSNNNNNKQPSFKMSPTTTPSISTNLTTPIASIVGSGGVGGSGVTVVGNNNNSTSSIVTKKSKTYDKHPNEVVKSEELTLGGKSNSGGTRIKNNCYFINYNSGRTSPTLSSLILLIISVIYLHRNITNYLTITYTSSWQSTYSQTSWPSSSSSLRR